jgi:hypothetical protein
MGFFRHMVLCGFHFRGTISNVYGVMGGQVIYLKKNVEIA